MLLFAIVLAILCASSRAVYCTALFLQHVHKAKVLNAEGVLTRTFVLEVAAIVCGIVGLVR